MNAVKSAPPLVVPVIVLAGIFIVLLAMQATNEILAPIILAFILAICTTPMLHWFIKKGAPSWLALLLTIGVLIVFIGWIGFFAGLAISVLCLPYYIYVLVDLLQEETLSMKRSLLSLMIVIVLVVGVAGYVIGKNNRYFMTCHNFEIHGDFVPDNCVKQKSN